MVEAGSGVVFRWTIDDKQSLTFHNVAFNVIYQSAAVFKLSVGEAWARGAGGAGVNGGVAGWYMHECCRGHSGYGQGCMGTDACG